MNNFHMREGKVEFRWKRWRNKKRQEVSSCLMVLFSGMVLLGAGGVALAGPTGGQVTGGTGTITQNGGTTNIDQTSNVLNINWTDFSIGQTETVNFNQPDSNSLAINRVIGGVPSQLAGALNANGRVFILNSAGITFTGTSHVNVGALLATTAMTVNGDPTKAASYSGGTGYGAVINQGSIQVSNGGFAILAAPYVQNTGFIKADLGTIALAGTNQFTLDLSGTGLINFVVPAGTVEQIVSDGKALGVDNSGTLQARSGQLIISANVATQVINAAVNLNGVIDADAFAPNGAGGSVLVTGAGDINIGGQVTARGDGAGAGGQIITKAGGADAIEALAFVSAAGGTAGGKGGLIEVSGEALKLDGDVDPGSGGSIFVDPKNILVLAGAGSSHNVSVGSHPGATTNINEGWLATHLQAGQNVTLAATHDVTFRGTNAAADFILLGGGGNLTVTAGQDILFSQAKTYEIETGGGRVALTATAGNIGSAAHRLSVVSGVGVNQAGDVVLNAGHDLFLDDVTIKSVAGGVAGNRRALLQAHGGHDIDIAGSIDVEASAAGHGVHASADVNLFANHDIAVNGAVTIFADALGSSGSVKADAELIVAASRSVTGNNIVTVGASSIHFADAVDVEANAISNNNGFVAKVGAKSLALLAANLIAVDGPATIRATASGNALHPVPANALASGDIEACATLIAEDGTLNVAHGYYRRHLGANDVQFGNAVDVEANAVGASNAIAFIGAHASAELYGVDIVAAGEVTIRASTDDSRAKRDIAAARLIAAGSANSQSYGIYLRDFPANDISFGQGLDVEAFVNGGTIASAADALALGALAGNNIAIGGNVIVLASATGHGLPGKFAGTVFADAHLAIGTEIRRNDTAHGFYESGGVPRNFASNIHIDGAVDDEAIVSGSFIAAKGLYANATADIRGARSIADSIAIDGPLTVDAEASGCDVIKASADARVVFHVGSGELLLPDHLIIDAQASGSDANLTCAEARAQFHSSAVHRNATLISSDGLTVTANANGHGGNFYAGNEVFATASISAQIGHITINPGADHGSVFVQADANGFDVRNIIASDGVFLKSYSDAGAVTVNVPVTALATAHGTGHGSHAGEILAVSIVYAHDESIAFAPGSTSKPAINVGAIASGHSANDITANARSLLGNTPGSDIAVDGAVIVHALAKGSAAAGTIDAFALGRVITNSAQIQSAKITATASGARIGHDVTASADFVTRVGAQGIAMGPGGVDVEARANGNHVTGGVLAHASGSFSDAGLTSVDGNVKILALASGNAVGTVHAEAYLFADDTLATGLIFGGTIDVEAHANVGRNGANSAGAIAMVDLAATGSISILVDGGLGSAIKALASADPRSLARIASADASVDVSADGDLFVNGNVTAQALAKGIGPFSASHHDLAEALMHLEGSNVTIGGNLRSLALANGAWSRADATVEIIADGAPGNINLFQNNDPIARATAGNSLTVFRQAHASTAGTISGPHGSVAADDIDIVFNGKLTRARRPPRF